MPQLPDPERAVAQMHAAGDDIEALTEAIQAATFLEDTPGDAPACTKLRQLVEAAKSGAAERSPHAKAEYSTEEFEALVEKYPKLNWRMVARAGGATVKPDDFYRLYALHMQATQGDNQTERPMWAERGGLDFDGRARWDAWAAIKGMDTDKAKLRFVKIHTSKQYGKRLTRSRSLGVIMSKSGNYWDRITPEVVLRFDAPADGYLCPLSANTYGIEFLKFDIRDYDTGKTVYQSPTEAPVEELSVYPGEEALRSVRYAFPSDFLTFKTIRTSLEFRVGDNPVNNFRMIELHYFKGKMVRVYDFTFGFCIPNSTNTWEAIYDVPQYTQRQIADYVASPFEHKSDSYYFVDGKLIMHNKAEYQYV